MASNTEPNGFETKPMQPPRFKPDTVPPPPYSAEASPHLQNKMQFCIPSPPGPDSLCHLFSPCLITFQQLQTAFFVVVHKIFHQN